MVISGAFDPAIDQILVRRIPCVALGLETGPPDLVVRALIGIAPLHGEEQNDRHPTPVGLRRMHPPKEPT